MGNFSFSFLVGDRTVVVLTGPKTQTINVCTPANVRSQYEVTYRVSRDDALEEGTVPTFRDLDELRAWLVAELAADETMRSQGLPARPARPLPVTGPTPPQDDWFATAARLVDEAVDQLVDSFVAQPYLHRVEHSLHAELFSILRSTRHLGGVCPIGTSGHTTGLVHKEWPETTPRPAKDNRRGSFDLAVLSPRQLADATVPQFRLGRLAAGIVLELGLDYGVDHLEGDVVKLDNSAVPLGFLIHFSREKPASPEVEKIVENPPPNVRIAYVNIDRTGAVRLKHAREASIIDR